ncbi:MAG: ORF6N domain-containing protein [Elusimicrobiales bacterium]|nr:ORF6N domain-containing protein [Elusimicrobiales bacterium]
MPVKYSLVPLRQIERLIFLVREHRVMLDSDLAGLYGVTTGRLNEQVRRNIKRFPPDFMFQLTRAEFEILISQNAISRWGGRRQLPLVFTQEGIAMLSSVLNSDRAIEMNIAIMRAFVQLREMISTHKDLTRRLDNLEKRYNKQFRVVFDTIRELMTPPEPDKDSKRVVGFTPDIGKEVH